MAREHTNGIHHVTAITGDPLKNVRLHTHVLGLQFVKKTVNFDDPFTYHFYFGDAAGRPGSLITFFPWSDAGTQGRKGAGTYSEVAYSIPTDSAGFWLDRLKRMGYTTDGIITRFGEETILVSGDDALSFALVAAGEQSPALPSRYSDIPPENAISGIFGATLTENDIRPTTEFLVSALGFRLQGEENGRYRFRTGDGDSGTVIDCLQDESAEHGTIGVGNIHHVAFRAADKQHQLRLKNQLERGGFSVTPVINRTYFHSIYFAEPGGAVCEIATDGPGFTIDEPADELGTTLRLPPQYEPYRAEIERTLPPVPALTEHTITSGSQRHESQ
jgi:glyoxalase family protein